MFRLVPLVQKIDISPPPSTPTLPLPPCQIIPNRKYFYHLPLDFMENGTTMNGFYKAYVAKCKMKFGMKSSDVISLKAWQNAVVVFWKDILNLDMKKKLCM